MSVGGRVRRVASATTVLLVVGALSAWPAGAAPRVLPLPSVSAGALGGSVNRFAGCDGQVVVDTNAGFLKVERGADTSGDLSVDVTYGGTLTPGVDYPALPDPVVIEAGETFTILPVEASTPGTVTLTVDVGAGYVVGDPVVATSTVTDISFPATCHDVVSQTIGVGSRPTFLDHSTLTPAGGAIYDTVFVLTGNLPTGMAYVDGRVVGVASTPGTFEFVEKRCLGEDRCVLEVPYRITVVAAQGDGPKVTVPPPSSAKAATRPATAAAPVRAEANFTG